MKMTSSCRVASVYNRSIKIAKGRENMLPRMLHGLGTKGQILERKKTFFFVYLITFNWFHEF